MNYFILLIFTVLSGQTAFAQKEYVDPAVKKKRPLLDSAEQLVKEESSSSAKVAPSSSNPKIAQYCACVNSQRITAQAGELHRQMYLDNHVDSNEYYRMALQSKADEKKSLINLFVNREELEPSDIDCDVVKVNSKKFREFLKEIERLDAICKFEEIKRKKY